MHIEEVIVVEGEHDRDRVQKAVRADVIVTGGSRIRQEVYLQLERAAKLRGLIILTDPDYAGEQIRRKLAKRFPASKHAYLAQQQALKNGDIGVENAPLEDIVLALSQVRSLVEDAELEFSMDDLIEHGLIGTTKSAVRREQLGKKLQIGYANGKSFLKRLNTLRVSREEFLQALVTIESEGVQ